MKIEKRLKEEVELTNKQILEKGQDLKAKLKEEYCVSSQKPAVSIPFYKRKSAIVSVCCVFVCLLVVGVCLPLLLNNASTKYFKENEVSADITLESIYDVVGVRIDEANFSVTLPTVFNDSVSGDVLYYKVRVDAITAMPYGDVYFVANKNYKLFDKEYVGKTHCKWKNYNVNYNIFMDNLDNMPVVQVIGCLEYGELRINFSYIDMDLGETVTPIAFLDLLLK